MATTYLPEPRTTEAAPTTYRAAVVHDFASPPTVERVSMPERRIQAVIATVVVRSLRSAY
jgi:hypothetical protein